MSRLQAAVQVSRSIEYSSGTGSRRGRSASSPQAEDHRTPARTKTCPPGSVRGTEPTASRKAAAQMAQVSAPTGRCLALGEGLADGAAALGVTAGQHDTGPGVGQRLGESRSEASCPAGDDGDPAFEVETVHSCHVTLRA